jgi:flagellar biosynthetic protein FliO
MPSLRGVFFGFFLLVFLGLPPAVVTAAKLDHSMSETAETPKPVAEPEHSSGPEQEGPQPGTTRAVPPHPPERTASPDWLFRPEEIASAPAFLVTDPWSLTLRLTTSLAIIIGMAFVLSWALQRRGSLRGGTSGRVLGILPLDRHARVVVVEVLGKILLLGVTDHNVSLLSEITDKITIDELRLQADAPPMPGLDKIFTFLRRAPQGQAGVYPDNRPDPAPDPTGIGEHTAKAKEQIRRMNDLLVRRNRDNEDS